jgi:hypothetical protein
MKGNPHDEPRLDAYDRMSKKIGGQARPVYVMHEKEGPVLWNGHHRSVVAMQRNQLMPVTHAEPVLPPEDPDEIKLDDVSHMIHHEDHWDSRMDEITGRKRR